MKKNIFLLFLIMLSTSDCYSTFGYSLNQVGDATTALMNLYAQNPALPPFIIMEQTTNLLALGAQINEPGDPLNGYTALMAAAANPAIGADLIAFLLRNGAATGGRQNYTGETVLTIAARADRSPDIIKLLIDAGSDPFHIDRLGNLDIHGTVYGNTPLNYLLVNAKIHQNSGDQIAYNQTIQSIYYLMEVLFLKTVLADTQNVFQMLTAIGNYGPNMPSTTLSLLAYVGDMGLLKTFLSYFGDLIDRAMNQAPFGKTALSWASNNEIFQQLRAQGATP